MTHKALKLLFVIALAGLVTGCGSTKVIKQSVDLNNLNKKFTNLVSATNEAATFRDDAELDGIGYASAIEGYQFEFEENGNNAKAKADKAKTAGMKVSFLSVAARSYLKSGAVADKAAIAMASDGKDLCKPDGVLVGSNALPTTCGYFHTVEAQALNNANVREHTKVKRQIRKILRDPNGTLDEQSSRKLETIFNDFIYTLVLLSDNRANIVRPDADKSVEAFFHRQQDIMYCMANMARVDLAYAVKQDGDWNLNAVKKALRTQQDQYAAELRKRSVKFPDGTCINLQATFPQQRG